MPSAKNTAWKHKAFEVVWRLAILLLPWQTRWFMDAQLAGWPWEQGRISFYISWLPLIAAIVLGSLQTRRPLPKIFRRNLFWLVAALGACTIIAAPSPATAAIQWWIQIILLAAFFIVLIRTQVTNKKIIFWFIISLVPHAFLAVWQFASQSVFGSSWLGMSSQNPVSLGVSVIQTVTGRILRSYGGFPHPNILGGWMAAGLILTVWLLSLTKVGERSPMYIGGIEGLFTLALFYSFSRSAWLAAAVGLVSFVLLSFRAKSRNLDRTLKPDPWTTSDSAQDDKNKLSLAIVIPIVLFILLAIINRDFVLARTDIDGSRLEQKSISTRIQTLKDGVAIYRAVPLFGTGPNSELPVLAAINHLLTSPAPLEPPHMVWLLILVDFGTIGALFIFGFGLYVLRRFLERWPNMEQSDRILLSSLAICFLVLASLDHYPWSLWSGQTLSMMILYFISKFFDGK